MNGLAERLHAIAKLTRRTIGSVSLAQHAQEMVEEARAIFGMDACVIRLIEGEEMVLLAAAGLPEKSRHKRLPIGIGISKEVLERRSPLHIPDVREHPVTASARNCVPNAFEFVTYAGSPLLAGDRVIGMMGLYSVQRRDDFTPGDLDCIQIMANNISVAIANDGVYEQLTAEHDQLQKEIAARRRAEKLLEHSIERLRLAAETARMFAFEWNPLTDSVTRSADCAEILSISDAPTRDTGKAFFARIHPDDRQWFVRMLEQLSPHSPTYRAQYRVVRPDGGIVWLEENARGLFDHAGQLIQLVGMTRDITEMKRAQQEALQLRENLARVGRIAAMGELTATIAHEVNQPLSAVVVSTQACENFLNRPEPSLPDVREALKCIARDAVRAADIVQQVRNFLNRGRLACSRVDLNATIQTVLDLVNHRIASAEALVELELEPTMPAVSSDRTQLQQLVLNLLGNAIDAVSTVPPHGRRIWIKTQNDGHFAHASIADSGPGLPSEDTETIFRPLFTTKPDGMGMGLAICRSIIQANDGHLWVEPNPNGGAIFHFTLRLWEPSATGRTEK